MWTYQDIDQRAGMCTCQGVGGCAGMCVPQGNNSQQKQLSAEKALKTKVIKFVYKIERMYEIPRKKKFYYSETGEKIKH